MLNGVFGFGSFCCVPQRGSCHCSIAVIAADVAPLVAIVIAVASMFLLAQ